MSLNLLLDFGPISNSNDLPAIGHVFELIIVAPSCIQAVSKINKRLATFCAMHRAKPTQCDLAQMYSKQTPIALSYASDHAMEILAKNNVTNLADIL